MDNKYSSGFWLDFKQNLFSNWLNFIWGGGLQSNRENTFCSRIIKRYGDFFGSIFVDCV